MFSYSDVVAESLTNVNMVRMANLVFSSKCEQKRAGLHTSEASVDISNCC